jgi:hypothetical protein
MQPLHALKRSLRHASSDHHPAHDHVIELSIGNGSDRTASRHSARILTPRSAPADPYRAWLEQREADREREAHRLNPRAAWDDLRTQGFHAVGRS